MPLPIDVVLPELRAALRTHASAVLQAPPGAGKTTGVPLALLNEPWLAGRRIVLLEPRRLAARAAARRMATTLGEPLGATVGYRIRLDTVVGPTTRIEVVTEGILTRFLQEDPSLEGVGLVIFDEFHERSLHADLGLALTLETQTALREDLRLLVMSATLDGAAVSALLDHAPIVTGEGRSWPVEIRHTPPRSNTRVDAAVASAVRQTLASDEGDVLAFLPGAGEIRRAAALLAESGLGADVTIAPLYGNLSQEEQDRAIQPSPPGRRKVVLATSIAETSLTIEGVRVVIDGGLSRLPRFSPRTGMTRLDTVRVSRAAADQRCGRAGRVGPGICVRLWHAHEEQALLPRHPPEILEADLAPLALELAAASIADPATLRWLDLPPVGAFTQARDLLRDLGALDAGGRLTEHGRRMARFPLHPRLAHMLLTAKPIGLGPLACDIAALLGERDILSTGPTPAPADIRLRVELLRRGERGQQSLRHLRVEANHLRRRLRVSVRSAGDDVPTARPRAGRDAPTRPSEGDVASAGLVLALAYPDRIAQRRNTAAGAAPARYLLRNGRGAFLEAGDALAASPYLVTAELGGRGSENRVFLAAPLDLTELEEHFGDRIEAERDVTWDAGAGVVRARRRERLGAIVLREGPLADPDPALVTAALVDGIRRAGLDVLPWTPAARQLQQRVIFMRQLDPSWPDFSDAALADTLADWLGPHLTAMRGLDDVRRLDLIATLTGRLDWQQRQVLDHDAPTHFVVPSGSRLPIDYADASAPVLAVRLQEMFGLTETPRVARGRVPLTLHLLSPAHRPVQVTRDLAGFWRTSYFEVRKDLRGRYPKHHWPDDPLSAAPTALAKRRAE